mmetsp:Transcript_58111/g.142063  ORF Transcript_58111/g.142063 Transcript_58111/m.142063 type:complete len:108 (-) Transcript_58111:1860-2183(-)
MLSSKTSYNDRRRTNLSFCLSLRKNRIIDQFNSTVHPSSSSTTTKRTHPFEQTIRKDSITRFNGGKVDRKPATRCGLCVGILMENGFRFDSSNLSEIMIDDEEETTR